MKQKTSTSLDFTTDYDDFAPGHTDHLDDEYSEASAEFLAEPFNYPTNMVRNQMKNEYRCAECRSTVSGSVDDLNRFDSDSEYEDSAERSHERANYEESVNQKKSSKRRISIRLSCQKPKAVDKKVRNLNDELATMNDNIQNLNGELFRLQNFFQRICQEHSALQSSGQQQSVDVRALKSKQDMSEEDLLQTKQKLEDLHYATYDGSPIWSIEEFTRKFSEAVTSQRESIDSPLFYSSTFGYKMRVRLHLCGDGDARDTHMSISLVILRGEYDPILTWPFNFQVSFCLFDQTGEGHHVVDSFYPDPASASFQQPCSDENTANGILKFLPLAILQQQEGRFVQNDKMYIRTMVDSPEMPRAILPYTLSINPGLTTYQQEAIRCRVIEEHNQIEAELITRVIENDQEVASQSLIPVYSPGPAEIRQQPTTSAANLQCVPCEDALRQ